MAPINGFWGAPTASIDWCEQNYVKSYYIAEFYNSLSSLVILFIGEYCAFKFKSQWPAINAMFRAVSIVGIGSVMFHATLLQPMQMLDEIPMLWSALSMLYIVCTARYGIKSIYFKLSLLAIGLGSSFAAAFFSGIAQFYTFQLTFLVIELLTVIQLYYCVNDTRTSLRKLCNPVVPTLLTTGLKYYLAGVVVWLTDTFLCKYINSGTSPSTSILPIYPQLHAFWHIFASLGVFNFATFVYCYYLISTGKSVNVKRFAIVLYTVSPSNPKL